MEVNATDSEKLSEELLQARSKSSSDDETESPGVGAYFECERLWEHLKKVQAEIQNKPPKAVQEYKDQGGSKGSYEALQQIEKRLRGELLFLQNKVHGDFLSPDKEIQLAFLKEYQRRRRQYFEETLSYLKGKRLSLINSIEQEKELNTTLKKVQNALKVKQEALRLSQSSSSSTDNSPVDTAIADLKVTSERLKQSNIYFKTNLKKLLSEIPSPSETQNKQKPTDLDNTKTFDEDHFVSLNSIIGDLVEQTVNFPEQPYVDVSERMWPQHIEFLLRTQIIVKHPDCSSRMKLVPFHL